MHREPLCAVALKASLTVRSLTESTSWYRDVVGFEVAQQYEREGVLLAVSLRAGEVRILLTQDDGAKGIDRLKGEGISLQLTTDQDIDEIAQRIKDAGGALESEPTDTRWGPRTFRLRDPDGYQLVISSGPTA